MDLQEGPLCTWLTGLPRTCTERLDRFKVFFFVVVAVFPVAQARLPSLRYICMLGVLVDESEFPEA